MPTYINGADDSGLVLQKKMVQDSSELASLLKVLEPGAAEPAVDDKNVNAQLSVEKDLRDAIDSAISTQAGERSAAVLS
jgi:hypothetical protein